MSTELISTDYRELRDPVEIELLSKQCRDAWKHSDIPRRQYERCVKGELEQLRMGQSNRTYDALIECMRYLPMKVLVSNPLLLDVGASGGYYSEVLRLLLGFRVRYRACDFSQAFRTLGRQLYPEMYFDAEDACAFSYHDDSFDIILHSACIMHIYDYHKAIAEAVRVANSYILFHRTPVHSSSIPTKYYVKKAYGVECLELEFNEYELLALFDYYGLNLIHQTTIFTNPDASMHRTYLLAKREHERHIQV